MRVPALNAELVPGVGAAGFRLGEAWSRVEREVQPLQWCDPDVQIGPLLISNQGWLAKKVKRLFGGFTTVLFYRNEIVRLSFSENGKLYQIVVGRGYEMDFCGVRIGDNVLKLEEQFTVEFESSEDAFYIAKDGQDVLGVSFITDHRASLDDAPHQVIEGVVIADYAIARL